MYIYEPNKVRRYMNISMSAARGIPLCIARSIQTRRRRRRRQSYALSSSAS